MARPRESTPNAVSDSVRQLRESQGLTQQEFANRLGVAITTIARWETIRPPNGKSLAQLYLFAVDHQQYKLAQILHAALANELWSQDRFADLGKLTANVISRWLADLIEFLGTADMSDRRNVEEAIYTLQRTIRAIAVTAPGVQKGKGLEEPMKETK